ncbi:hypothetical protein [Demequina oxidasica]|uniref:hypothetical protein n=1 Tax=Demequina oxidasica TaxID=676199 RepID=UPI0007833A6B|nr:hypothetical protein [Demequina oxidasica]
MAAASVCVAVLVTAMTGCAGEGEAVGGEGSGAVSASPMLSPSAEPNPTPDPEGDAGEASGEVPEIGADAKVEAKAEPDDLEPWVSPEPSAAMEALGEEANAPAPMAEGSFLTVTQDALTAADVAEMLPVPLEDTEEAAFHTAFALMNTSDDVYASAADEPGELSFFAAISADECGWCASVLDTARAAAASNLRVTGATFSAVGDSFDGGRTDDGSVVVNIPVEEAPTVVWNTDGSLSTSTDGGPSTLNIQLVWRGEMWKVIGVSTTE